MDDDAFKIYVDQLTGGAEKSLEETLSPEFLDIQEKELAFMQPVHLSGIAYTTDSELVLNWSAETKATLPCSICNELIVVPIQVKSEYTCVPLKEIKTGIFDYRKLLREAILIEVPQFVECNGGNCPLRKEISKHLKTTTGDGDQEGYHPFADLDWKT